MSEQEMQETMDSAAGLLSSHALAMLAKRAQGTQAAPAPPPPAARPGTSGGEQALDLSTITTEEELLQAAQDLPLAERAKLAWTGMVPVDGDAAPATTTSVGTQAVGLLAEEAAGAREPAWRGQEHVRYDLQGALARQDAPYDQTLHHHGDAPEEAGYTLRELVGLARSTVGGQRTLALTAITGILQRRRAAIVRTYAPPGAAAPGPPADISPPLIPKVLPVILRCALDDGHAAARAAGIAALEAFAVAPEDTALSLDVDLAAGAAGCAWPPACAAPHAQGALPLAHQVDSIQVQRPGDAEEEGGEGAAQAPKDGAWAAAAVCARDVWVGLAAMHTVHRLATLLTLPQATPVQAPAHAQVLHMLTAAVRADPGLAHGMVHMRTAGSLGPRKPKVSATLAGGDPLLGSMHPLSPLALALHSVAGCPAGPSLDAVLALATAVALSGPTAAAAVGDGTALEDVVARVGQGHAGILPPSTTVLALRLWRACVPHSRTARDAAAATWALLHELVQGDGALVAAAAAWLVADLVHATVRAWISLQTPPTEPAGEGATAAEVPQEALGFTKDAAVDQLTPFLQWAGDVVSSANHAHLLPPALSLLCSVLSLPFRPATEPVQLTPVTCLGDALALPLQAVAGSPPLLAAVKRVVGEALHAEDTAKALSLAPPAGPHAPGTLLHLARCLEHTAPAAPSSAPALAAHISALLAACEQAETWLPPCLSRQDADVGVVLVVNPALNRPSAALPALAQLLRQAAASVSSPSFLRLVQGGDSRLAALALGVWTQAARVLECAVEGQEALAQALVQDVFGSYPLQCALQAALALLAPAHLPPSLQQAPKALASSGPDMGAMVREALLHCIGPRSTGHPRRGKHRYNSAVEQLREARALAFPQHIAALMSPAPPACRELPLSGHGVLEQAYTKHVRGLPLPRDPHWAFALLSAAAERASLRSAPVGLLRPEEEDAEARGEGMGDPGAGLYGAAWLALAHSAVCAVSTSLTGRQGHMGTLGPAQGLAVLALVQVSGCRPQFLALRRLAPCLDSLTHAVLAAASACPQPALDDAEDAEYWQAEAGQEALLARCAVALPASRGSVSPPLRAWTWAARWYTGVPPALSRFMQQGMAQPTACALAALALAPGLNALSTGVRIGQEVPVPATLRRLPSVASPGAPPPATLAWDMLVAKGRVGHLLHDPAADLSPPHHPLLTPHLPFSAVYPDRLTGGMVLDAVLSGYMQLPETGAATPFAVTWAAHHIRQGLFTGSPLASTHTACAAVARTLVAASARPSLLRFLARVLGGALPLHTAAVATGGRAVQVLRLVLQGATGTPGAAWTPAAGEAAPIQRALVMAGTSLADLPAEA